MKYDRSEDFKADYMRLKKTEQDLFRAAVRALNDAYERRGTAAMPEWPAQLRIKDVEDAPGIFEMTWCFSGPDGRATFEFITIDGEPAIRWRRVGGHRIFKNP